MTLRLVDLQKFMFIDRYHLTTSTLARVCASLTGLILRIASFNRSSTSLLLLVLNAFLKVKAVYFKVDSTIFRCQCSTYSAGAPRTCTSSIINFLGAEGPFLDEVGSSRVVWCNCCLAGCVGAFSQLLKCFSKLLAWLIVFLQWGGGGGEVAFFSFLMGGSQCCCFSAASLEKNLVHLLHLWFVL